MNAKTKSLLTVSAIAARNGSLPWVKTDKAQRNALFPLPLYPSNPASRPSGILTPAQETMPLLRLYACCLRQDRTSTILPQYNRHSFTA